MKLSHRRRCCMALCALSAPGLAAGPPWVVLHTPKRPSLRAHAGARCVPTRARSSRPVTLNSGRRPAFAGAHRYWELFTGADAPTMLGKAPGSIDTLCSALAAQQPAHRGPAVSRPPGQAHCIHLWGRCLLRMGFHCSRSQFTVQFWKVPFGFCPPG